MFGANVYAYEALIESDFKKDMITKVEQMRKGIEDKINNQSTLEDAIALIFEQKKMVEKMREEYEKVYLSNSPDKFETRVKESRFYSIKLTDNYRGTDYINEQVNPVIVTMAKFMQNEVLDRLKAQFEDLCIRMHTILVCDEIDVEGGVELVSKIPGVDKEVAKKLISQIRDAKKNNPRLKHDVVKKLEEWDRQ